MPKVSIVIPSYNMARYIGQAIESALNQTYGDREVIVVDDGSSDETPHLARSYIPHIRYYWQENQGLVAARNQGIRLARGVYVSRLDADDVLCPDTIAQEVALMEAHPRVGLVHGQVYIIDEGGNICGFRKPLAASRPTVLPSDEAFRWLLRRNRISVSTVMVRKSTLDDLGELEQAFTGEDRGEDWEMWLHLAARHDIAYIPRPLAYRRQHTASITAQYSLEAMEVSHRRILQALFSRPDLPYAKLEDIAYANLDRILARQAVYLRQRLLFWRYLARALKRKPRLLLENESWSALGAWSRTLLPASMLRWAKRRLLPYWYGNRNPGSVAT